MSAMPNAQTQKIKQKSSLVRIASSSESVVYFNQKILSKLRFKVEMMQILQEFKCSHIHNSQCFSRMAKINLRTHDSAILFKNNTNLRTRHELKKTLDTLLVLFLLLK